MKKALAVVLAVMMLGTLAFAVPAVVTPSATVTSKEAAAVITTEDGKSYYLVVDPTYFNVFEAQGLPHKEVNSKFFKVEGLPGKFDDAKNEYVIPIANKDVGQDGTADLTITGPVTITYGNPAKKNVAVFEFASDGRLMDKSLTIGGEKKSGSFSPVVPVYNTYDIGRETTLLTAGTTPITKSGWYRNDNGDETVFAFGAPLSWPGLGNVKIRAAEDACFKVTIGKENKDLTVADIAVKFEIPSLKVSNAVLEYKYATDLNQNYYCAKDGTVYASGMNFAAGKWTKSVAESMAMYKTGMIELPADKVLAAPAAPANPKNPATGANDVVGVAAALAVVALVSGAAISLKK